MSKYAIEVKDVKKSFFLPHHKNNSLKSAITQAFKPKDKGGKTFNALDGISFNVEKGDFFGILGRNGSGKSTLLKIISEIYQPTSGSVKHDGKLVSFIELGVGFKPELSGRENVFLNGGLLGFSRKEVEDMYDEIVSFAELEDFMDQKLKNYSSGMKVRLAFSVAIRAKADILILDEVLAVGDAAFRKKCSNYFKKLKEAHKTVVLVTHGMGDVREYCNKAIVIDDGKIIYQGEAEGAADEYMRLFNPEAYVKKQQQDSKPLDRYGSGEVKFENIEVDVYTERVLVNVDILTGNKNVNDVVFGIDIQTSTKQLIGGIESNTLPSGRSVNLKAHEKLRVSFEFDNVFGSKDYVVTASIKGEHGEEFYDFWRAAANFSNVSDRDRDGYFPVTLPAKMYVRGE